VQGADGATLSSRLGLAGDGHEAIDEDGGARDERELERGRDDLGLKDHGKESSRRDALRVAAKAKGRPGRNR
jgi:hypothetical protein